MSIAAEPLDAVTFHTDIDEMEQSWQRRAVGTIDLPVIDQGQGNPVVFVPILEHLEFVYSRQMYSLRQTHRVITYRRRESFSRPVGLAQRAEELKSVIDALEIERADFVAHGDAAMVLFEFAARYPKQCRSLVIISQGADYRIRPHPLIWWLHELLLRLPVEHVVPATMLRRTVVNYIVARRSHEQIKVDVPHLPRALVVEQFRKIALWPRVYKFSVLPVIHTFDIRDRLSQISMPVQLINRTDDALVPEPETHWLAQHLPDCRSYHVVYGGDRFFLYSNAEVVTPLIEGFLSQE